MEFQTMIIYVLSFAVIVTLISTLAFLTRAIKEKNNPAQKQVYFKKAGLYMVLYLLLNVLRNVAEGWQG